MQVFFVVTVVALGLSSVSCRSPPIITDQCVTTAEYAPVCGADGKVYGNRGAAACAKVHVAYRCPPETSPKPVCGKDGKTYYTACEVKCAKAEVAKKGRCECICITLYDPVCGVNGKTYGNTCQASCSKVPVRHKGRCRSDA